MHAAQVARGVEEQLRRVGDPARALHEKRYLKSDLRHFGASVPAIRKIAREAFAAEEPEHDELIALVEALSARPVHECRMAAVELLDLGSELVGPRDVRSSND